jgi:hypothetical protein
MVRLICPTLGGEEVSANAVTTGSSRVAGGGGLGGVAPKITPWFEPPACWNWLVTDAPAVSVSKFTTVSDAAAGAADTVHVNTADPTATTPSAAV